MAPDAVSNRRKAYLGLGSGAAVLGSLAYVGLGDPHSADFVFPTCPFKALTGWNCPACGGLRMTHDLLHGDLTAAVVDNVFLLVGLPLLAIFLIVQRRRGRPVLSTPTLVVVLAAATVWTVVRNLPGFPLVPTLLGA